MVAGSVRWVGVMNESNATHRSLCPPHAWAYGNHILTAIKGAVR